MPVHVERINQEIAVVDSQLPLGDGQLEALVELVLERLEQRQRAVEQARAATRLEAQAAPRASGWE